MGIKPNLKRTSTVISRHLVTMNSTERTQFYCLTKRALNGTERLRRYRNEQNLAVGLMLTTGLPIADSLKPFIFVFVEKKYIASSLKSN